MEPALSVVVPTTKPWPEVRPCLDALLPQLEEHDIEAIVVDGHGGGVPTDPESVYRRAVRVLEAPGDSVFELRARAVSEARGRVVAITEDHCVPARDWCQRLIEVHAAHPDIGGVAGAVGNGARNHLIDWANFFLTFAAVTPPIAVPPRYPPISNVSFKRSALPPEALEPGWLELHLGPALMREGRLMIDDTVRVDHIQSNGFFGTLAAHYHNGRSTTGLTVWNRPRDERRRRLRRQLKRPLRLTRQTWQTLRAKQPMPRQAWLSLPLIAVLALCHALGEAVGLVFGPGASPKRLA